MSRLSFSVGTYGLPASVGEQVAKVAAEHQPDEPGYGQTAWDAAAKTVYWVSWDGTSVEEHDAAESAFLAIPGVEKVVTEAESVPPGWWDAEVVYPDSPPRWVVEKPDEEAAIQEIIALASQPLVLDESDDGRLPWSVVLASSYGPYVPENGNGAATRATFTVTDTTGASTGDDPPSDSTSP